MQPAIVPDFGAIREAIQELYGPDLRQIGTEFNKPYPEMIDRENHTQGGGGGGGYKIPNFSLFSREDGQFTLEHVARFTMQFGELANYENFYHFKLTLFPNYLTGIEFTWYTTLPRNSIQRKWKASSTLNSSGLSLKCALQNYPE